jgi:hypothetical protein
MRFIENMDLAILDRMYQRIADWIQDKYGVSHQSLACIAYLYVSAFCLFSSVLAWYADYYTSHGLYAIAAMLSSAILTGIKTRFVIKEFRRLESKTGSALLLNKWRQDPYARFLRLMLFCMSVNHSVGNIIFFALVLVSGNLTLKIFSGFLVYQVGLIAFGSMEYLAACTPKPPKPKIEMIPAYLQTSFSS